MFGRSRASFRKLWGRTQMSRQTSTKVALMEPRISRLAAVLSVSGILGLSYLSREHVLASGPDGAESDKVKDKNEPHFTRAEVAKHNSLETRIWIIHEDGVYDVTEFLPQHPGGPEKLMLAAGASVDPYWRLYRQHFTPFVQKTLQQYRIGALAPGDRAAVTVVDPTDPYANEPSDRHPALGVRDQKPFNAEPPASLLLDHIITPNELWYIRNHLPVPVIDPKTFKLEVTGEGLTPLSLTLDEIKALPKTEVTTTIQCAGNRRKDLNTIKPTQGLAWAGGAISTATFTGVRLRDLMKIAGLKSDYADSDGPRHVWFEGADEPYDASIPFHKAMDPRGDVIIAYEMNGEPISRDHGFPLRAVVPGVVGARNVKWLRKIITSQQESKSTWQSGSPYRGMGPNQVDFSKVDLSKHPAVQELPIASAILSPPPEQVVPGSEELVTVKGYAVSGGGRDVIRVDVSPDDGKTWTQANLTKIPQEPGRAWAWTFWDADLPIPKGASSMTIRSKAVDEAYNVQPDETGPIWNLRGILNNAQPRLQVKVSNE